MILQYFSKHIQNHSSSIKYIDNIKFGLGALALTPMYIIINLFEVLIKSDYFIENKSHYYKLSHISNVHGSEFWIRGKC